MGRFYYIINVHDVATNLHLQGLIYCMNVFTLNIRKDLHGDSNMLLFKKRHVITKSGLNNTLYWEELEDIKMLIRSRYSRKNVTMEITPILNFISIIQGRPQDMCSELTKSTKDAHKANAIKYIPVIYKVPMKALLMEHRTL
jgi:hypothetical protein